MIIFPGLEKDSPNVCLKLPASIRIWQAALILFLCLAIPCLTESATTDSNYFPTSSYTGTTLSNGTYTYGSISARSSLVIGNATVTLTGQPNGVLNSSRNLTISLDSLLGNNTLVLQNGTLTGRGVRLSNSDQQPTEQRVNMLLIGAGGGAPARETVTINGNIAGAQAIQTPDGTLSTGRTTSIIQTNGAHLQVNGYVVGNARQSWIGQIRAWNGNITVTSKNPGNMTVVNALSVHSGNSVTVDNELVVYDLELEPNTTVSADSAHIYTQLNNAKGGMQPGSRFSTAKDIVFIGASVGDLSGAGGISGASGEMIAGGSINARSYGDFDLLQGSGSLALRANRDIIAKNITADVIAAGGNVNAINAIRGKDISAGVDIAAVTISGSASVHAGNNINAAVITGGAVSADRNIIATTSVSGSSITAGNDIVAPAITGGAVSAGRNINATTSVSGSSITAGNDIVAPAITGGAVAAGRDVRAASVSADSATASRNLVVGSAPASGQIILASAGQSITPNGSLTASTISAPLVAAGEISDRRGVTGRVETSRLLVVKNEGDTPTTGDFTLHSGSFAFVGSKPAGESGYNADGSIASHTESAWIGGDMSVNNTGESSFTTLGVGGSTRISGGSLTGGRLNTSSARLHGGVSASIENIRITDPDGGFFAVGAASDTGITQVSITNLALNGTDLRVGAGGGSARAMIRNFASGGTYGNFTDSDIYVGHNGMLALGTDVASWLPTLAETAKVSQDAAILGVATPFTLGGGLHVDSSWSQPQSRSRAARVVGGIDFSPSSLLVIDGSANGVNYAGEEVATTALPANAPGALSSQTAQEARVAGGARIYIDHVTPGHTYVALGRNITTLYEDDTAWSGANLLSSNPLLGLERLGDGKEGQFGVVEHAPHARQMTVASGVPRMAHAASEVMEEAIYHRIRLGHEDLNRHDWALWALPLYQRINEFDLDGGNHSYGYTGGIGGLAIGCDRTWENMFRFGAALNIGAGYARSTGEVTATKNHMDFWGAGLYGVWKPGAISLDGEVDFTSTYNKLKQDAPSTVPGSELKADAPAWALGASLRIQYEFDTDWLIIRPHAGVRYFHLNTSPYDVKLNGQDVIRSHRSWQNVWTFPVGIVFTKEIKFENGWELLPLVNIKAIPASGDIYVKNSIRYTGSEKDIDLESQVMDSITYGGRVGLEARSGDGQFSFGLNYMAQFGSHTSNQGVFGVLRYEF